MEDNNQSSNIDIEKWLETALDFGIDELSFWGMTLAEVNRAINSRIRIEQRKAREKASYDYILADLIGKSIARIYNSNATFPSIEEVYPTVFNAEEVKEKKEERKAELSALRFKLFAEAYNRNRGYSD